MERLRWSGVFLLLLAGLLIEAPRAAADGNTADLYAIVSGPSQVVIGDKVGTGFIDIFNRGPDVATGILFTAKLTGPGQYDAALSPSVCHVDGPSATCKLDNLPLGGVANLLDLTVDTTGLGTIVQSWAVSASQDDPTPSNNSGEITTAVVPPTADLVGGIIGPSTYVGETPTLFTVYANNYLGPATATGVVLTDTFSGPGVFDAAASDSRCSASGQIITCSVGTLIPNLSEEFTIAFVLTPPGTFSQTVHVSGASPPDPNPSNDSNSLTTAVVTPTTDLAVSLKGTTFWPLECSPCAAPVFTASVSNLGPLDENGFVLTDTFSGPGRFDADASDPRCSATGQTVTCNLGRLLAFTDTQVDIVFFLDTPGTFSQTMQISGQSPSDPNPTNDSASLMTSVVTATADLAASVTGPATAAGSTVPTSVSITNMGPLSADGVVITDTFSGPAIFDAAASDPGCSASGQTVTCNVGFLFAGAPAQVNLVFAPTGPGTLSQTVHVSSASWPDPNPDNDSASLTTLIPAVDLGVAVGGVTTMPGSVTVQLVATNLGPDDGPGDLTITWSPSGTGGASFAGVTGSGGCFAGKGGGFAPPVSCSLGPPIPNGGSANMGLTLTAPSGTTVTITASITGTWFDPSQSNNSTSVSVVVP